MALNIENDSGGLLPVDDLGIEMAIGQIVDVSLVSDPFVVANSATGGDLDTLVTATSLVVKDPIDGTTNLSVADGLAALRAMNETHWRVGTGARIGDVSDVTLTAAVDTDVLQFNGTDWINVAPASIGAAASIQLEWRFSTNTTAADPGNKNFRFNSGTPASVTAIYVSDQAESGVDASTLLTALSAGDQLYIQQTDEATAAYLFTVVSSVDNTGWFTITVTLDSTGGVLPGNNKKCGWVLIYKSAAGVTNAYTTITGDTGSATAIGSDTITFGGTGIDVVATNAGAGADTISFDIDISDLGAGTTLALTDEFAVDQGASPNVSFTIQDIVDLSSSGSDQNLWETITSDSGSAVANTTTDTLTIAGGTGISTAVSGDTLTITNTRVFGDNSQEEESDGESATTSTTFQNKLTLTTPSLPSGAYRIGYSCETRTNSAAVSVEFQVDLNSGTIIANGSEEPDDSGNVMPNSGFRYETLSGINTIDLDWRVNPAESAGTAYIRRARLEIWRVS